MDLKNLLIEFWNYRKENNIEIYNEFSLQHELGIFLRNNLPEYKVQFERNVSYFFRNVDTKKKEMDIVIFRPDMSERYAVELKYPKNGQHPEQMFAFIGDIKFMERVKELGFNGTFVMTFVEDRLFYDGNDCSGIYAFFRANKELNGTVQKPTGKRDDFIKLNGSYKIQWNKLNGSEHYYLLEL